MDKKYSAYLGRWQPFHNGHDFIIRKKLEEGKSVLIAVRDTPITEINPYTTEERVEMISEHYKDDDVKVIIIPDIESVNIGRKVGYEVNRYDAPEDIEGISATEIRNMMTKGDEGWKTKVPPRIADYLISRGNLNIPSKEGLVIWLTGLPGSGKSTLAHSLAPVIGRTGRTVKILDGDEVRKNLTSDLGFSKEDRSENIKRISYVAKVAADCGGVIVVAVISPYEEDRVKAKELIGEDRFLEVYVSCDIEVLKKRDVKGLYSKALAGEIKNFTGISDPYETPVSPGCMVETDKLNLAESISKIKNCLDVFLRQRYGYGYGYGEGQEN